MTEFTDSENRPYLHLVDGGVSDNIGVRGVIDALEEAFISREFARERGIDRIDKVVVIVANAHSEVVNSWEKKESPPGLASQLLQSSGVPIERYSFETIELMKDRAAVATWRRDLLVAQARLAGMSEAEAEASVPDLDVFVMEVSFDRITDPVRRSQFQDLPTSFVLPEDDVDGLRDVAGELMRQSPEYKEILHSYENGTDD
jgi:NTE family protein